VTEINHNVAAQAHTLAGVFPSHEAAATGVRYLEHVGFEPWRIEVIEDPRRALEIGVRRYARQGLVAGFTVGLAFVLLGAFALGVRVPGIEGVVAPIAVIGGWSLIGFLAGYGVKRRGPDADVFESAFREGASVVAVRCTEDCDVAEHALAEAGAYDVLDETASAL
jgi:hypothetical protein